MVWLHGLDCNFSLVGGLLSKSVLVNMTTVTCEGTVWTGRPFDPSLRPSVWPHRPVASVPVPGSSVTDGHNGHTVFLSRSCCVQTLEAQWGSCPHRGTETGPGGAVRCFSSSWNNLERCFKEAERPAHSEGNAGGLFIRVLDALWPCGLWVSVECCVDQSVG